MIRRPPTWRARAAILKAGGAEAVNVFTRIQLALFGAADWADVPTIPAELILAPKWLPVHLSKVSYWARTVVVPLLVLCTLRPRAQPARGAGGRAVQRPAAPHHQPGRACEPGDQDRLEALDRSSNGLSRTGPRARASAPSMPAAIGWWSG
jgi:squalene-hopene/tetraprenyl-beta-curcumene cyclase